MRASAISNARWIAVSRFASIGVQLVGVMWLSRLLTPADYGLVAMALVATNFANLVRDLGTAQALIQKEDINDETVLTIFWLTLIIGAGLGLGLAAFAPLLAQAFDAPGVTGLLWVLALTFPILGMTTVQQAMLERQSRFSLLARIESVAAIAGLVAGVTAAHLGAGAYSLALQSLVTAILSSVQLWFASGWRPRWFWSQREFRGIWQFSGYMVAFSVLIYFTVNTDKVIVGRFLGASSLGLYSLAYKLILLPLQNLSRVATRASYPILSRQQDDPEAMLAFYLRMVSVIAFVTAPMMAGLFMVRDLTVEVLLGSQWTGMGDVLFWLAPLGYIYSVNNPIGILMLARGRTDVLFFLTIIEIAVQVPALLIGLQWGVAGVAAGCLAAALIDGTYTYWFTFRSLGLKRGMGSLLRTVMSPTVLACVMAVVVAGCKAVLPIGAFPPVAQLVVLALIGAASYALLAYVFARQSLQEALRLVRRT